MTQILFSYSKGLPEDSAHESAVAKVVEAGDCGANALVNVHFSDASEMQALNKKWRGRDAVTDVLSFEGDGEGSTLRILGDLVICLDKAQEQANEWNHTLTQELAVLTAHGLMHLLGHDHELGEAEAKKQADAENELLEHAGFSERSGLIDRSHD